MVNQLVTALALGMLLSASLLGAEVSSPPLPAVDIPYTKFVLPNGLTLLVHEDRKAAQVAINLTYNVGSKDEPAGRSGLAHLFEHLMFEGSEHLDGKFTDHMRRLGGSRIDAATTADHTTFFEIVPSGSLDAALWMESDRMGHLLGVLDQARLDKERSVVKNEKLQRENRPDGVAYERIALVTWPAGHPYAHTTSGAMADLNAITLDDAKQWFSVWYGAANAVLVLSGDIAAEQAREKVERYFGSIPPGSAVRRATQWVAQRQGTQREVIFDSRVAAARITRIWNVPGAAAAEADYLALLGAVLSRKEYPDAPSDSSGSRLQQRLIVQDQIVTDVSVNLLANGIGGQFTINVTAVPGVDASRIELAIDDELQRLLRDGPSAAELASARALRVAQRVQEMQRVAFKAWFLARNELLLGSADRWKAGFERMGAARSADLIAVGKRWLSDGDFVLLTLPRGALLASGKDVDRSHLPVPVATSEVSAPKFVRATLSNGLPVLFAERHDAPEVALNLLIETGVPATVGATPVNIGRIAMRLANEGAGNRNALDFSSALAALGATLVARGGEYGAQISLTALKSTLPSALDLFADALLRPAFNTADLRKAQALERAELIAVKSNPSSAAQRLNQRLLFGADHPYGRLQTDSSIASINRDDVLRFHREWIRPNRATLIVVGDTTLATLLPQLERSLGGWQRGELPATATASMPQTSKANVWLLDAPGAQQSDIQLLLPVAPHAKDQEAPVQMLTAVVSDTSLSRLNQNLREDKHWAYIVRGSVSSQRGVRTLKVDAPVQSDKTAAALVELSKELQDVVRSRPVTQRELQAAQTESTAGLAARWETNQNVVAALGDLALYSLDDDYLQKYASRVGKVQLEDTRRAAMEIFGSRAITWIVVGDLSRIEADIRALNFGQVRVIDADGKVIR